MIKKVTLYLITIVSLFWGCTDDRFSEIEEQFNRELAQIDQYLVENNLIALALPTGVRIVFLDTLGGSLPRRNDTVVMDYTSFMLDNTIFDTSDADIARDNNIFDPSRNYSPEEFPFDAGQVIPAWDIGVSLLPAGSRAIIFSPSGLAYGNVGLPPLLPPDTPAGFAVEILEIRN